MGSFGPGDGKYLYAYMIGAASDVLGVTCVWYNIATVKDSGDPGYHQQTTPSGYLKKPGESNTGWWATHITEYKCWW